MKLIILPVLALILIISSCNSDNNEVIIKGKFTGEIPEYFKKSIPVNGIGFGYYNNKVDIDSSGTFEFKIETPGLQFIEVFYPDNQYWLVVEPGETYNIQFEIKEEQDIFKIEGKNSKLIEIYQTLLNPMHPNMECPKYSNLPVSVAKIKIDSMYNAENQIFESLLHEGEISQKVFKFVKSDRNLFYQSLLGATYKIKYFNTVFKDKNADTDSIMSALETAVTSIPFDTENFIHSKWTYFFLESYLEFKEFGEKEYYLDDRKEARKNDLYHTYRLSFADKYLLGDILEFYIASNILTATYQEKYEKELISLFEEFKLKFPESKYTLYVQPHINDVFDFHKKAKTEYNSEIIFVDDYKKINTLDELLKPFKGRKVYIDNWATWCGYCKDELKHAASLSELANSKNIVLLYISIDRDSEEKRWLDMIKYYDLRGYHIRANEKLNADIISVLNRKGVPHYAFFDEMGKIISKEAPYPSSGKELAELIEKHIN